MPDIAKTFWSGRSQAVRLPDKYRFGTDEVSIRRVGNAVVLEPVGDEWAWLKELRGSVDEDFAAAAEEDLGEQHRPELDYFK